MKAGVVKGRLKLDKIDEAVEVFATESVSALARIPGCSDVQFWVDRESGEFLGLGVYENDEARAAAGRVLAEQMPELAEAAEGVTPARETYELASSITAQAQAVVQRIHDAFNRGDLEQLARHLAPDVVARHARPGGPESRGPQAVKEYYQGWRGVFPDLHVSVKKITAAGGTVVVEGTFEGTHTGPLETPTGSIPPTGRRAGTDFVEVFTFDRGMIREIVTYSEYASLLMQLGLTPSQITMAT